MTVKASTSKGYEFVNWTDGSRVVSSSQAYTFTVNASTTLVANFRIVPQQYTVSLSSSPVAGGTVSGGGSFAEGSEINVRATAGKGYEFVNWTEGTRVVSILPGYTFTLNGNKTLVANFKIAAAQNTLTLSSTPLFGGNTLGAGKYDQGTTVTISAVPEQGYDFINWTEGNSVVTTSVNYKFTLNGDRSLVANFREKTVTNTVALSAAPVAGGTVSGGGTFTQGSSVTVTATPVSGYEFVNWTEGTSGVSNSASYTFTLSANRSLTANFTLNTPIGDLPGSEIRVWPNPVTTELYISGIIGSGELRLADISGRVVYISALLSPEIILPMAGFLPGIYLLSIETPDGRQVRKIVKQ